MIEQFQKDKRPRRRIVAAEAVTRSPKVERDSSQRTENPERRSYNPNFSAAGKFIGGGRERSAERDFNHWEAPSTGFTGDRERDSERRRRADIGEKKPFGGKKSFGNPEHRERTDLGGKKPFGGKPSFGDKKPFGTKKPFVKRGEAAMDAGAKPVSYPSYNAASETSGEMRLNRFIALSGKCSRREADELIAAGDVTVNGVVVNTLGSKIQPTDEVKLRGETLSNQRKVYIVMNKPKGYVTSMDDPHADKTVMDIVRNACAERIYPVGRLDKSSVGVLLMTNDGELTQKLTHPSHNKKKIYQVTLERPLTNNDLLRARDGIDLDDGIIIPDAVEFVKPDNRKEVGIEIHSGRNRIVRRIFEEMGYGVHKLDRVYFAGLTKKNLKRGQWRFLSDNEVAMLKSGRYE